MKWIQTGLQIGQAVKNIQRLRHILAVFARHGFADLIDRMELTKYVPARILGNLQSDPDRGMPERLKEAFEELGPAFVKLGQLLSTRPDLVPDNFIQQFVKLQDNVNRLDYAVIKTELERELGSSGLAEFNWISEEPLASASIAQVHEATLRTGERVILKIQRPGIAKIIDQDVSLLAILARLMEKTIPESKIFAPSIIVDEFFRTLSFELDFIVEANNMTKFANNMKSIPEIRVPKVYKNLSTKRVLTQEMLIGIKVNDIEKLKEAKIDPKKLVETGARAFFRSIMIDGLFHGDLHGGNLFALPGNQVGMVDFGIVGRLSEKSRSQLANMVHALLSEDFEHLCYQYAELGTADASTDFAGFERDLRNTLAPYLGLNISEVNSGKVLIEATRIATRYQIQIPGDWMLVFKAILTMEGMGRTLDPSFNFLELGHDLIKELIKEQYSMQRLSKDFRWILKDLASLMQVVPRQIRWMFRRFNQNDFAFEIRSPELGKIEKAINKNSSRIGFSLISASLFLASSIALQFPSETKIMDYPFASVIYLLLGLLFLVRFFFA